MAVRHYHYHHHFSYTTSFKRHLSSVAIVLAIITLLLFTVFHKVFPTSSIDLNQVSPSDIALATFNTLTRLLISYVLALVISIPLAVLITSTRKIEKFLLPVFDVLQSIPVLAFFPVIVLSFVKANFLEGAAIFIMVISIVGSLVFSMIGGLKTIPEDISNTAQIFGARGLKRLIYITLPAIFPYIMTGSLLAFSQAWNIIIVAEALHTYIPGGNSKDDLFGLGSLLVNAFSSGQNGLFLASLATMIVVIALLNFFVWQKLLQYTQKFRFD